MVIEQILALLPFFAIFPTEGSSDGQVYGKLPFYRKSTFLPVWIFSQPGPNVVNQCLALLFLIQTELEG